MRRGRLVVPLPAWPSLDPLLKNRAALFWTLHVGGWLAYALSQYLGTLMYDEKYEHMTGYGTSSPIAAVSGFLLSLELRYIYRRLWNRSPRTIIGVRCSAAYVFALMWRVIINSRVPAIHQRPMEWDKNSPLEFFGNAMSLDLPAAVLDRHLLRHQVLRVAAAAA